MSITARTEMFADLVKFDGQSLISTISIIGSRDMAAAFGCPAAKAALTVEVGPPRRGQGKGPGGHITSGVTTGSYGAVPAGHIVILVPYGRRGRLCEADGKDIIDISNPPRLVSQASSHDPEAKRALTFLDSGLRALDAGSLQMAWALMHDSA